MKRKLINLLLLLLSAATSLAQEPTQQQNQSDSLYIPTPPNYSLPDMWITSMSDTTDTGADIFYIVSTWEEDWHTTDGLLCHYADVWNPSHRYHMAKEMNRIAAFMAPSNNFYAPYYRHMTMEGWMTCNEDTINRREQLSMHDVFLAFEEFLRLRDPRRPIIIAGFSQGGYAVVQLLKHISDDTYRHLAAAYVLGYKVTPQDTLQTSHIVPAQSDDDTGVTICYNTVKDVKYINPVIAGSCIAINPVNWRTDERPATLHDTIQIRLDTTHHVIVATNYSASEYRPYKGFLNVGDIHSCEPWLYSDCLRENILVRTRAWREENE